MTSLQRLSELSNHDLVKEIDDDAVAREVAKRFLSYEQSVSEQIEALENRILKLQGITI
jgi:hypothetical protein